MKQILVAAVSLLLLGGNKQASASLQWNWTIAGTGVAASGTFTTEDTPDAQGFYQIIGITGTANGGAFIGLQPSGTAIPGNSGYSVDNLVSTTGSQLTGHGFGFSVSGGAYHNPFYLGGYRDYVSAPPYVDGAGTEPAIEFTAVAVAEPAALMLFLTGLCTLAGVRYRRCNAI